MAWVNVAIFARNLLGLGHEGPKEPFKGYYVQVAATYTSRRIGRNGLVADVGADAASFLTASVNTPERPGGDIHHQTRMLQLHLAERPLVF